MPIGRSGKLFLSRARTDEFDDLVEWLGEVIRHHRLVAVRRVGGAHPSERGPRPAPPAAERALTANARAVRVLVRNAMFRRVQLIAADDLDDLARLDGDDPAFTASEWDEALDAYYAEHDRVLLDADARGPRMLRDRAGRGGRTWQVRQIVADPEGNHDWQVHAVVDLDASDERDELALRVVRFGRI